MFTTPSVKSSDSGFTLIELSMVIIIIGLLVGGVLVGKDLIHQPSSAPACGGLPGHARGNLGGKPATTCSGCRQ